jgi:methionine-rich copper-binding protein CopC
MRDRMLTLAAMLAGLCLLALPEAALGHVELISSSPAAGANVDTAPCDVTFTFDDELDPDLSSFTVTDADGTQVGSGAIDLTVADRNVMNGSVTVSAPGVYMVRYTVAGVDGHELHGTFSFGFQAVESIPAPTGGEHGPDTALPAPRNPFSIPVAGGLLLLVGAGCLALRRPGAS